MEGKITRLNLEKLPGFSERSPTLSPRPQYSFRASQHTARRNAAVARAIQAPSPGLSAFYQVEKASQLVVEDEESDKDLVFELRQQVEDIWHEYAAARKRSWRLTEEKEALQSQVYQLKKALRQEEYNRRAAEKQLKHYKAAAQQCQVEQLE